jgi:xylulokinase
MAKDLIIGIDSSTTATKAIAWDAAGRAVAEGRAAIALANPKPGYFEQDARDWWESAAAAIRAVLQQIAADRVAGIGISNQRETFGLFREDGEAVRPAIIWLDERAKPQAERFAADFGADRVHAISGKPKDVTPPIYRFLWLGEHEAANWRGAERVAEVHAFLTFKLTGLWASSTASADPMGILDMAAMDWSAELLKSVGLKTEQLPRLHRPGSVIGEVNAAAAAETGLKPGTPVVAGGGDGQCAGTGTDTLRAGRAYVNLGTAVVSGSFGTSYAYDPAFRTMSAVAERGYIYESCLRTGTFLVDWMVRELFQIDSKTDPGIYKTLEAEAAKSPIGAKGLVLVPYWSGCMTPYWDANARGLLAGFTSAHRRGDVYRALLEGIALEQAMVSDRIAAATKLPIDHYVAIGGGAASDLWCGILADAAGRPVHRLATVEASALGAAMAAAVGAGWHKSMAGAAAAMAGKPARSFVPDDKRAARYAGLLAIYRDLWPAVSGWNRRLSSFTESIDA